MNKPSQLASLGAPSRDQASPWAVLKSMLVALLSRMVIMIAVLSAIGLTLTYAGPLSGLRHWDASINETLADSRSHHYESIARFVTRCGDTLAVIGLVIVITIGVALVRRSRLIAFVAVALLMEVSTFAAVNYIVQRPRPHVSKVGPVPSTYSFPSGHIAATLVCWLGLALVLRYFRRDILAAVVAVFGIVAAAAMGWARVYLGMHHFLDVVVGVGMGLSCLYIAGHVLGVFDLDDATPVVDDVTEAEATPAIAAPVP